MKGPYVTEGWLQWKRGSYGRPFRFLEYSNGQGSAASGDMPDAGLRTRTVANGGNYQVVNRLAIEELDAWDFDIRAGWETFIFGVPKWILPGRISERVVL